MIAYLIGFGVGFAAGYFWLKVIWPWLRSKFGG